MSLSQPAVSRQISRKTGLPQETCSYLVAKFVETGLLICLNPKAQNSRLYWLTEKGRKCQQKLCRECRLSYTEPVLPTLNWPLYGWVCYRHRSAVIKALAGPMQPSEIKRILRLQRSPVRISANNIRDIIRLFLSKGIVCPVNIPKKAHLRYALTELGTKLRRLLLQAEAAL